MEPFMTTHQIEISLTLCFVVFFICVIPRLLVMATLLKQTGHAYPSFWHPFERGALTKKLLPELPDGSLRQALRVLNFLAVAARTTGTVLLVIKINHNR
jgi:hypothetical protein